MKQLIKLTMISLLLLSNSCTSYPSLLNYNEGAGIPLTPQQITNYKPLIIQANDILEIKVSSVDEIAIRPFRTGGGEESSGGESFLVSSDGFIDFPTIGKIQIKGLEIEAAKSHIQEQLKPYFEQDPIIQVRLTNFRINVNGEVGRPGSFNIGNDRLTIIEALTMAGDFTSYSRRDSILIIREQNGVRNFGYVNFNSSEIFSSPYFYLSQNDVIYVQPDKAIVNTVRDPANRFLPWISALVSVVALSITIGRR